MVKYFLFFLLLFLLFLSGCVRDKTYFISKDLNLSDVNANLQDLNNVSDAVPDSNAVIKWIDGLWQPAVDAGGGGGGPATTDTTLDDNVGAEASWLSKEHVFTADNNFEDVGAKDMNSLSLNTRSLVNVTNVGEACDIGATGGSSAINGYCEELNLTEGKILASGKGSFASGFVKTLNFADLILADANINCTGDGAFCFGNAEPIFTNAYSNEISGSGAGSFAGGSTNLGSVISSGEASFAFGTNVRALADYAIAIGQGNKSSGAYSSSIGRNNTSTSPSCLAFGELNNCTGGGGGAAFGAVNDSSGLYGSPCIGYQNDCSGNYGASGIGYDNNVSASNAVGIGGSNTVSGFGAVAIGSGNTVSVTDGVAVGTDLTVYVAGQTVMADANILGDNYVENLSITGDLNNSYGYDGSISVRKGDDSGACLINVADGIIIGTTC